MAVSARRTAFGRRRRPPLESPGFSRSTPRPYRRAVMTPPKTTRVLIMGAAGRDFHNFNVYWKQQPDVEVVAFTATQIPNIDGRTYPASLAGPRYPQGVAIHPESQLEELIQKLQVDVVSFAYSDVSYDHVMHQAARTQAAGASFQVLGPRQTWLESKRPVIAVGAVRTGSGKSQTSRYVAG